MHAMTGPQAGAVRMNLGTTLPDGFRDVRVSLSMQAGVGFDKRRTELNLEKSKSQKAKSY